MHPAKLAVIIASKLAEKSSRKSTKKPFGDGGNLMEVDDSQQKLDSWTLWAKLDSLKEFVLHNHRKHDETKKPFRCDDLHKLSEETLIQRN